MMIFDHSNDDDDNDDFEESFHIDAKFVNKYLHQLQNVRPYYLIKPFRCVILTLKKKIKTRILIRIQTGKSKKFSG